MPAMPLLVGKALSGFFRFRWFFGTLLGGAVVVAAAVSLSGAPKHPVDARTLPVLGALPSFDHTDQTGAPFTDRDLAGRVAIASFVFTRCPTVCPVVTAKVNTLAHRLEDEPAVLMLSFTVDPEYDTPQILAEYASRFGADPARWKFVTGTDTAIRTSVESSLKIAMDRRGTLANGVPDIVHGTHLVLLDGGLRIRGYYDYTEPERLERLLLDARALSRAPSAGAHDPPPSTLPTP